MIERSQQDGVLTLRLAHGKASALDVELLGALLRELDVQRAGLAVRQAEGEDAFVLRTCDHLVTSGPTGAPVRPAAERPAQRPRRRATTVRSR